MLKKVKRICLNCGREFTGSVKSRYCCPACKQAAYRARLTARPMQRNAASGDHGA